MFRNKLTGIMSISAYAFVVVFLCSAYIPELRDFLPAAVIVLAIVANVVMLLSMPPEEKAQAQNR